MLMRGRRLISAALIVSVLFTGCSRITDIENSVKPVTVSVKATTKERIDITTAETTPSNVPFVFNPHVYSCFLESSYGREYKESFFNLVDALSEGKDTFKCSDEKVYEFCMDPVTLNQLYPVACMQISGKNKDGSPSFENGTGHICYEKPVEEYLERQAQFRQDVTDIINRHIKSDYSDFEKCLALYDYIASDYSYDHEGAVGKTKDGSAYTCFKLKKGICCDIGAWYAYLLMECGVNAIEVQNFGRSASAGYHAWTFVDIGGKGYHIDPTWALKTEQSTETLILDYLMMTDKERADSGYPADELEVPLVPGVYAKDCKEYKYVASDSKYHIKGERIFTGRYDTKNNVIYYGEGPSLDNPKEFKYE